MIKSEDLEKSNPSGLAVKIIPSNETCDNSTEADPSIVYGNNNYLVYVSDKDASSEKYGVYLHSFLNNEENLIISKKDEALLGPIVLCATDVKRDLLQNGSLLVMLTIIVEMGIMENSMDLYLLQIDLVELMLHIYLMELMTLLK